jgi:D-alanyl-D-alanine carboxypeptidase
LLYAILLKSANDAANVLAEAVGGSQSNFVAMMNARAKQLGATHTRFSNAHGLPSSGAQYTTAKDMAKIMQQALKNKTFRRIITYKYRVIYSKSGRRHFLEISQSFFILNWKSRFMVRRVTHAKPSLVLLGLLRKKAIS